jgi:hypothetical protein
MSSPGWYPDPTDQGSGAITVGGRDAWRTTAEVRVDDPEVTVKGDVPTVVVVETDWPDEYGLLVSVVPIGAPMLIGQLEQVGGVASALTGVRCEPCGNEEWTARATVIGREPPSGALPGMQ